MRRAPSTRRAVRSASWSVVTALRRRRGGTEYDFGYVTPIGQVCIRWDDFKNITYGATSVRLDTSVDGHVFTPGPTYDEYNSSLPPGNVARELMYDDVDDILS